MPPVHEPSDRRQSAGFSIFLDEVVESSGVTHWETRLYHAESGAETTLPGVRPEDWADWMLRHAGPPHARRGQRSPAIEVGGLEILEVALTERAEGGTSVHTVTAQVVLRFDGVAGVERRLGAQLLRGIVALAPGAMEVRP